VRQARVPPLVSVHRQGRFKSLFPLHLAPDILQGCRGLLSLTDLERALGLSARSLLRRKHGRLNPVESERFLRLVRVVARAEHVLGARDAALDWLRTANPALGGKQPISLLDTEIGAEAVNEVLGRIEYTVYG
jgi:putative toxin-antitoxin system antitoxin component (TIGR02293 family)